MVLQATSTVSVDPMLVGKCFHTVSTVFLQYLMMIFHPASKSSGTCNGQTYSVQFDFSVYASGGLTTVYTSCLCAERAPFILFSLRKKWETVCADIVQRFHFSRWCRALLYCKTVGFFLPGVLESNACELIKNAICIGGFRSTKSHKTKD